MNTKIESRRMAGLLMVALACAALFAVPAWADAQGGSAYVAAEGAAPAGCEVMGDFEVPQGAVSGVWGDDEYAARWYLADGGETLVVGPGVVRSSDSEAAVTPDFNGTRASIRTVRFTQRAFIHPTASDLFRGFESLETIEGAENLSGKYGVLGADGMYAGCKSLKAISVGSIEFSSTMEHPYSGMGMGITDVTTSCKDAFAGCNALEKLDLGPGWRSGYVGPPVFAPEGEIYDDRATFPVDMTDGEKTYAAGDPVPDGEGHYVRAGMPIEVEKKPVAGAKIVKKTYTGAKLPLKVVLGGDLLVRGRDYTCAVRDATGAAVSPNKVVNAGKYEVTVRGKGSYEGETSATFTVARADIKNCRADKISARIYTGSKIEPKVKLAFNGKALKKNESYTVRYTDNRNAGKATATIKGVGNFKGKKTLHYTIKRAPVKLCKFQKIADRVYRSGYYEPKVKATYKGRKVKLSRDFTTTYKNNGGIGQARVIVVGKGNFKGKQALVFNLLDWVAPLNVSQGIEQLITVEARGLRATVSMHVKSQGRWKEVIRTEDGWLGADGLGDAREGVAYSPRGIMRPDKAFGIKDDPGCAMGYLKVDWSHWWSGDSYSSTYNQLVSTNDRTDFNMYASEHLIECGPVYNYCLNMGWNAACTPHGGSAFFMHCSANEPTAGCVSVPERTMVSILRTIEPGCVIAIDTRSQLERY